MLGLPLRSSNPDLADKKYIAAMFASGEQGAWYDPSDLSTMYQDAAGTIPVTAVGQPVGKILDKSGRGNHAAQSTTASRPTLSARINLLKKTEQFDDAVWQGARATITANNTIAPNGTQTADRITETVDNGTHRTFQSFTFQPSTTYSASFCWKKGTRRWVWITFQTDSFPATQLAQFFDLDNGVLGSNNTGAGGTQASRVSASITSLGDGWYRCSLAVKFGSAVTAGSFTGVFTGLSSADNVNSYVGTPNDYNWVWGADLRVANESANLPAYQRVNTDTDYDTAGFPYYLLFDGIDDGLVTGNINFTATDKMTVLAADHSAWDNVTRGITGLSSSAFNYDGTFWLTSYDGAYSAKSMAYLRGNLRGGAVYGPDQRTLGVRRLVRSFRFDISKDVLANETLIRLNGVPTPLTGTPLAPSAGSGNFGNWPLYIGMVGGSYPFSGRLYGLIVRGAATDDLHLTHAEKYLAYKSGVTL